jgi:hypothetical protein
MFEELSESLRKGGIVIYSRGGSLRRMPGSDMDEIMECMRAIQEEGQLPPACEQLLGSFADDVKHPLDR